jgi:hypothetical protein
VLVEYYSPANSENNDNPDQFVLYMSTPTSNCSLLLPLLTVRANFKVSIRITGSRTGRIKSLGVDCDREDSFLLLVCTDWTT